MGAGQRARQTSAGGNVGVETIAGEHHHAGRLVPAAGPKPSPQRPARTGTCLDRNSRWPQPGQHPTFSETNCLSLVRASAMSVSAVGALAENPAHNQRASDTAQSTDLTGRSLTFPCRPRNCVALPDIDDRTAHVATAVAITTAEHRARWRPGRTSQRHALPPPRS